MMRPIILIPCLAFLFNLAVILATWPLLVLPGLGSHEFARFIFLAKTPMNIAFVIFFIVVLLDSWLRQKAWRTKRNLGLIFLLVVSVLLSWLFDANRIFRTLDSPHLSVAENVQYPDDLMVVSVTQGGESHAYPLQYLAYHHLVTDTFGDLALDVTYCVLVDSVSAFVHPPERTLELVAARGQNSVYRDSKTGSWWQQASGEAIAGQMSGETLETVSTERLTYSSWREKHPNGRVMLPEPEYETLYSSYYPDLWPSN